MTSKVLLIVLLIGLGNSLAQITYVCPGIKMGYMFGEKGGFVFGIELSVVNLDNEGPPAWGYLLDFDIFHNVKRFHFGIEGIVWYGVGLDIGPTFVFENEESYTGFSIIPFGGLILDPYYNYTYLFQKGSYHEIGSYLKIPIQASQRGLFSDD
jgi:hypothetical protein